MVNRHSINYCVGDVLEQWNIEIAKVAINGVLMKWMKTSKKYSYPLPLRFSFHFLLGLVDTAENGLLEYDKIVQKKPVVSNCKI